MLVDHVRGVRVERLVVAGRAVADWSVTDWAVGALVVGGLVVVSGVVIDGWGAEAVVDEQEVGGRVQAAIEGLAGRVGTGGDEEAAGSCREV